mmetsp:Transcript_8846/g.27406  ORF Transcript_8846/g.27406 Transcript_8846/m.27406 type:complete len:1069 (+) Transcript_8846:178-3384(+)|eukprot:CAMPEP_0174239948 /NCGR_PEP_ID=MMETSP0417-20130205/16846_1 /TAXON_ID=242541 /ORGANISM="Mayorella sp, Strain BSH-02190019" /LENGTH=1068 /DNA_ID=CAMNT_0015318959 /DNA_START=67 /DNA_END=3273 /DNA_ORIENTATION=-
MFSMDLHQDFDVARQLRVTLVPVGDISPSKFKQYASFIQSSFECVDLFSITRPTRKPSAPSPFKYQSWQTGKIYMNMVAQRVHDQSNNDWQEFQLHRKVLGVIGIIDCSTYTDLSVGEQEFVMLLKEQFPPSVASRCFAFEPLPDQQDLDRSTTTHVIMIPNAREELLRMYLSEWMLDFALTIMQWMESALLEENSQTAYISTPLDPCKSADEISRLKKRKAGRLLKVKGDLCLQSCSPRDAIYYYTKATEACKSGNDSEWLAGCLEGLNAAQWVLVESTPTPEDVNEIVERQLEAVSLYRKRKVLALELEASVKLARFYISIDEKTKASEVLMNTIDMGSALSMQLKIQLVTSVAVIYRSIGFHRKFAFFLREAALLYNKIYNLHAALHLLLNCADVYGLEAVHRDDALTEPSSLCCLSGWTFIQRVVLTDLIATSKQLGDYQAAAKYICFLLRNYHPVLRPRRQKRYASELQQLVETFTTSHVMLNTSGMPQLLSIEPLPLPASLIPISVAPKKEKKSLFIYTPFVERSSSQKKAVVWVENQVCEVRICLENPLHFPLKVNKIELSLHGMAYESYPTHLILKPQMRETVVLAAKPLASGEVSIDGVQIWSFFLTWKHVLPMVSSLPPIQVLPAMPVLSLSQRHLNSDGTLCLQSGERTSVTIHFENCSQRHAIDWFSVESNLQIASKQSTLGKVADGDRVPLFTFLYDEAEAQRLSPLLPGETKSLVIDIQAPFAGTSDAKLSEKALLTISYGSEAVESLKRTVSLPLPISLQPALELVGLRVQPCPTDDLACLLLLEVLNPTSHSLHCSASLADVSTEEGGREVIIQPHSAQRLLLHVPRFTIEEEVLHAHEENPGKQFVRRKIKISDQEIFEKKAASCYSLVLQNQIRLLWRSMVCETFGRISTSSIALSYEDVLLLSLPEIRVSMSACLLGEEQSGSRIRVQIGQTVRLRVSLTCSQSQKDPISLELVPFRHCGVNGVKHSLVNEGSFVYAGLLTTVLQASDSPSVVTHEVQITPLRSGQVKWTAHCENAVSRQAFPCRSNVELDVYRAFPPPPLVHTTSLDN